MKKILLLVSLLMFCAALEAQTKPPAHGVDIVIGKPVDATPASLYKIYRANGLCSTNPTVFTQMGLPTASLTYSEDDPANTSFCFYATQVANGFESVPSNKVSVTTLSDPNAPSGITVTPR
jgi:hypothetical protein